MKHQIETGLNKQEIEKVLNRSCKPLRWSNLGLQNTMLCEVKPKKNQLFVMKTGRRFATYYYGFRGQIIEQEDGHTIIEGTFGYHEKAYRIAAVLAAVMCVVVALLNKSYSIDIAIISFLIFFLLFSAELWAIQFFSRRRNEKIQKDIIAFLHKRIEKKGWKKNVQKTKAEKTIQQEKDEMLLQ